MRLRQNTDSRQVGTQYYLVAKRRTLLLLVSFIFHLRCLKFCLGPGSCLSYFPRKEFTLASFPDGTRKPRNWYLLHVLSDMYSYHFLLIIRNSLYEAAEKAKAWGAPVGRTRDCSCCRLWKALKLGIFCWVLPRARREGLSMGCTHVSASVYLLHFLLCRL